MTNLFVRGYIHGLIQLECEQVLSTNAPILSKIGMKILYRNLCYSMMKLYQSTSHLTAFGHIQTSIDTL